MSTARALSRGHVVRTAAANCFNSVNPSKVRSGSGAPSGGVHSSDDPAAIKTRATSTKSAAACFELLRPSTAQTSGVAENIPSSALTSAPNFEQHPHGVRVTAHRGAMQRRDVVLVPGVGFESAREHRLEHRGVAALGGAMEHQVVLGTQLAPQARAGPPACASAAARSARAQAATKRSTRRELVRRRRARAARPRCRCCRTARPACAASRRRRAAATHRRRAARAARPSATSHRRAATCSGASPSCAPGKVRVRAMLEQPARAGWIVGPLHHVHERRHAAGDPVHVDAVAVQQLERFEVAAAAGDVRS